MDDVLEHAKALTQEQIAQLGLREAQEYREMLLAEMTAIDARLGSAKHGQSDLSASEHADWRRRALDAKRHMTTRYRALKQRISDLKTQSAIERANIDVTDPIQLVHALSDLLHRLRNDGVELDPYEVDLLIASEEFTKNHPL